MKKFLIIAIITATLMMGGMVNAFAAASPEEKPLDEANPIMYTYYRCEDGTNHDRLSFNIIKGIPSAEVVFGRFAYSTERAYKESTICESGWAVYGKEVYKLRKLYSSTPGNIDGVNPDYTGSSYTYKFELIPTEEVPENSSVTTHKHRSAVDKEAVKYLINGKEVNLSDYNKAKTGTYTESMKRKFLGEGKETVTREEISFDKLITIKQVGPGADEAPWSATFSYRKDQYIEVEHNYLRTYELTKSDSSSSDSPNMNDLAKNAARARTNAAVVIDVPTVTAASINEALNAKGLSSASVKTITIGKGVKKIKKGAFKDFRNAKTLIVKSKKLKKTSVKGSLKGSKITSVKVSVGSKKTNKSYIKKYKKIFTKKNAGRKAKVS